MILNRRQFLGIGGALLGVGALSTPWFRSMFAVAQDEAWLVASQHGAFPPAGNRFAVTPRQASTVRLTDLRTGRMIREIPILAESHSWVQCQDNPACLWGITKWGIDLELVDFRQGRSIERLTAPAGKRFFGHGLSFPNGELWISAHDDVNQRGEILVYRDGRFAEARPSFGLYPHEMRISRDGKSLIVANSGLRARPFGIAEPSVVWIDLAAWSLTKRSSSQFHHGPAHFSDLPDGSDGLFVVGHHTTAAVEIHPGDGTGACLITSEVTPVPGLETVETFGFAFDRKNSDSVCVSLHRALGVLTFDWRRRVLLATEKPPEVNLVVELDDRVWLRTWTNEHEFELRTHDGGKRGPPVGNGPHVAVVRAGFPSA